MKEWEVCTGHRGQSTDKLAACLIHSMADGVTKEECCERVRGGEKKSNESTALLMRVKVSIKYPKVKKTQTRLKCNIRIPAISSYRKANNLLLPNIPPAHLIALHIQQ